MSDFVSMQNRHFRDLSHMVRGKSGEAHNYCMQRRIEMGSLSGELLLMHKSKEKMMKFAELISDLNDAHKVQSEKRNNLDKSLG